MPRRNAKPSGGKKVAVILSGPLRTGTNRIVLADAPEPNNHGDRFGRTPVLGGCLGHRPAEKTHQGPALGRGGLSCGGAPRGEPHDAGMSAAGGS
jgi:hypothetical protein